MSSSSQPALAHGVGSAKSGDFRKPDSSTTAATGGHSRRTIYLIALAVLAAAAAIAWYIFSSPALPAGFAAGNGRLEANEIYVATKYPGRVKTILFNEGDTVEANQIVARMDTSENSRKVALAQIAVKQADFNYARSQNQRSQQLVTRGAVSGQEAEIDNAKMLASRAELVGAQAEAVRTASAIDAAKATADRIRAEINDAVLVAPIKARIQTRISEPGEVLGEGGRVFSLADLSDVYMYVFLPGDVTGKVKLGSEARIVLDAAPQYPIRAIVSYVSPTAQFTPKAVETAEERHNLTFRVKLQLDKNRLREYEPFVKSGLPGMGYVRFDDTAQWPENLRVKNVDPKTIWNATGSARAN